MKRQVNDMERLLKKNETGGWTCNEEHNCGRKSCNWCNKRFDIFCKCAEYEDIEEQLQVEYGANTTIKEVIQLLFKTIEERDGEFLKGFRILTNEDAKIYDEWKEQRDYWKHEAISDKAKLGELRIWMAQNGIDMDKL